MAQLKEIYKCDKCGNMAQVVHAAGGNLIWEGNSPVQGIEDGVVTAFEVSNMNLSNTRLVVLSACQTGLGDIQGSEGVYGLQRAFKMAGVDFLLMSLWKIPDDATKKLMTSFYNNWIEGMELRQAFRKAQQELTKYPSFFWAAFVLTE